jgi:hypothetical protein
MICNASAMVAIFVNDTNYGTMLSQNKASNTASRDFMYNIVGDASNISGNEGSEEYNNIRATMSTVCSTIDKRTMVSW